MHARPWHTQLPRPLVCLLVLSIPASLGSPTFYELARTTCYRLYPQRQSGPWLTTAQQQQVLGQLLNFAKCMRAHGLPLFPDPNPASTIWGSGGGQTFTLPSSINPNSSQFTSAENACKSLKPSSVAIRGNKGGGS